MFGNKYFVRKDTSEQWKDVSTEWKGCHILKIDGFDGRGKPLNIYTEQWINSQTEDCLVTLQETISNITRDVVVRANVDLQVTFIVSKKYTNALIDVRQQHDAFVDYMTSGVLYIKSKYTEKEVKAVCLSEYKPTTEKLHRGLNNSYILGTITLHTLHMPEQSADAPLHNNMYIGFGGANISPSEIPNLMNVQHYNRDDVNGAYSVECPTTSYLWVCLEGGITAVDNINIQVAFLYVPTNSAIVMGNYRCYRTANTIIPHTMQFRLTI